MEGHGIMIGSLPVPGDIMSAGLLVNALEAIVDADVGYDNAVTPRSL